MGLNDLQKPDNAYVKTRVKFLFCAPRVVRAPSLARLENRKLHNDSELAAAVLKLAGAVQVEPVRCSRPSGPGCWWSRASR